MCMVQCYFDCAGSLNGSALPPAIYENDFVPLSPFARWFVECSSLALTSSCSYPSAGIIGLCHHTWLLSPIYLLCQPYESGS